MKHKIRKELAGVLAVFVLILMASPGIYAQEFPQAEGLNPAFTASLHRNKLQSSSAAQTSPPSEEKTFGYIPSPRPPEVHNALIYDDFEISENELNVYKLGTSAATDAKYDMRDPNGDGNWSDSLLTPVKDQGTCGSCWSFATYGSLEGQINTFLADGQDFSEDNLKHLHGFDYAPCDGGNIMMSTAYLSRHSGPITEADDPYDQSSSSFYCSSCSPERYLENVYFLPARSSIYDNNYIKQAILDHGPLYVSIYYGSNYYNSTYKTYYCGSSYQENHAVVIVGWDDNKYVPNGPAGNKYGAFIIRNSWGSGWGEQGYFYVSYYDNSLAFDELACFDDKEDSFLNFDQIYYYDDLGATSALGYSSTTGWGANIFTPTKAGMLTGVGFYTTHSSTSYEVYVYDNFNGSSFSTLLTSQSGTFAYGGWHTIKLNLPVSLNEKDSFGIVVKFYCPYYTYVIPIEMPFEYYSSSAKASSGQSYISSNGSSWTDITQRYSDTNVCIKAFVSSGQQSLNIEKGQQNVDHNWTTVSLDNSFANPVVILGPPSYAATDPGAARLQNVAGNSFQVRFQEWEYLDGSHTQESIPYLVLEKGRYELDDGTTIEVGSFPADGTGSWYSKSFNSAFPEAPALFLTMQTYNGTQTAAVRARNVTQTGFQAALYEQEALMDGHLTETIGYLAIYHTNHSGELTVGGQPFDYNYDFFSVNNNFIPVFGFDLKCEEEKSKDPELTHSYETVAALTFDSKLFAQDVSCSDTDTIALRRFDSYELPPQADFQASVTTGNAPVTVAFSDQSIGSVDSWWWDFGDGGTSNSKNPEHQYLDAGTYTVTLLVSGPTGNDTETKTGYIVVQESGSGPAMAYGRATLDHNWKSVVVADSFEHPVVIAGPPSYNGADPGVVRLTNVNGTSFQARFQEWMYKDGWHTQETISYLVVESGHYQLDDGTIIEAGTFAADGTGKWFSQSFSASFPGAPALFLTMQTYNGTQTATVRARSVGQNGFQAAIYEEEALMDGHVLEKIGYVAIYNPAASGTMTIAGQPVSYSLASASVDHNFTFVLGFQVKLEEEQSKDAEVSHLLETVAALKLGDELFAQDVTSAGGDTAALRKK